MLSFSTNYPIILSICCLFFSFLYAYILYSKDKKIKSKNVRVLLFTLRVISITTICFLLLNPLIRSLEKIYQKPSIVIAQDVSSSIQQYSILEDLQILSENLEDKFNVFSFHFDSKVKEGFSNNYLGKSTNYNNLINNLYNRFSNRNLYAVILASDGLYNIGSNPLYNENLKSFSLFPIALGDTTIYQDILISKVNHNETALLGNTFPLEVNLESYKCEGELIQIQLFHKNKLIDEKSINIQKEQEFSKVKFKIKANTQGVQLYVIKATSNLRERIKNNNTYNTYIDVINTKSNILILTEKIHPDIAAYKSVIEKNNHYNISLFNAYDYRGDLNDYQLIVLSGVSDQAVIQKIKNTKIPILIFIRGDASNYTELYPSFVSDSEKDQRKISAIPNSNSLSFSFSNNLKDLLKNAPPLYGSSGEYNILSSSDIILEQKINNVNTTKPLLIVDQFLERKVSLIFAEGFWKMKLYDYRINRNNLVFDELFSKLSQLLLLEKDKSKFRILYNREIDEKTNMNFEAKFFNDSYQMVNDKEITLKLTNNRGDSYSYVFSKDSDNYSLDLGKLDVGEYSFNSNVKGTNFNKKGVFVVKKIQLEQINTIANHQMLLQLAENTNGKLFLPNNIQDLINVIKENPKYKSIIYTKENFKGLINIYWILLSLLFLLTIEWIFRKYNGLI